MTSLPVPQFEADALALARQRLCEYRDAGGFRPEAGHAVLRGEMKLFARSHQFNLSTLKAYARAGWEDAKFAGEHRHCAACKKLVQGKRRDAKYLLQQQLRAANQRLKTADGGNLYDLEHDPPEQIARVICATWRMTPSKVKNLIRVLSAELKELETRTKIARPKGSKAAGHRGARARLQWKEAGDNIDPSHPRYEAPTGDTKYLLLPAIAYPSGEFTGYMVRHGKGPIEEYRILEERVRSAEDAKALAERDYARWYDEENV